MDNCQLHDEGASTVGEAIDKNSKVKNISLRSNEIADEGVRTIATGLE